MLRVKKAVNQEKMFSVWGLAPLQTSCVILNKKTDFSGYKSSKLWNKSVCFSEKT